MSEVPTPVLTPEPESIEETPAFPQTPCASPEIDEIPSGKIIGTPLDIKKLDRRYLDLKERYIERLNTYKIGDMRTKIAGYAYLSSISTIPLRAPYQNAAVKINHLAFDFQMTAKSIKRVDGNSVTYYDLFSDTMKTTTKGKFYEGRVTNNENDVFGSYHEFPINLLYGSSEELKKSSPSIIITLKSGGKIDMKEHLIPVEELGLENMYPFTHVIDTNYYSLLSPISTFISEYANGNRKYLSSPHDLVHSIDKSKLTERQKKLIVDGTTSFEAFKSLESFAYDELVDKLQKYRSKLNMSDVILKKTLIDNGMLYYSEDEILEKIIEIQRPTSEIEKKKREQKKEKEKRSKYARDLYSMFIVSKYLINSQDDKNISMVNKFYREINSLKRTNFHYITPSDLKMYDHMETLRIYEGMNEFDFIEKQHTFTRIEYEIPIRYSFYLFLNSLNDGYTRIFHDIIYSTADFYQQNTKQHTHIKAFRFKEGIPITRIFKRNSLYDVPDEVTILDNACFRGTDFSKVGYVNLLPKSLRKIGAYCFAKCNFVTGQRFEMPEKVNSLGDGVFYSTTNLETIEFNERLTKLPYCFASYSSITHIIIPKTIRSIANYAFSDCRNLAVIVFDGESIDFIGKGSFAHISRETNEVQLPKEIIHIDDKAFMWNKNLKSLGEFDKTSRAKEILKVAVDTGDLF